jgi:hypothetical protein
MDTEQKWFLFENGIVAGPLSPQDVETKKQNPKTSLVWGRGMPEWAPFEKWKIQHQQYSQSVSTKNAHQEREWRVKYQGQEMSPMSYASMMNYLKTLTDLGEVRIFTQGYTEWKEVYQIHKVLDDLGVSRRAHPRVPIMGSILLEGSNQSINTKILSISEGGLGLADATNVLIGEKYKMTIKSPNLFSLVHATGEIVYVGDDNYAGVRFVGLPQEAKSAIVEYVKKFTEIKREQDKKGR